MSKSLKKESLRRKKVKKGKEKVKQNQKNDDF